MTEHADVIVIGMGPGGEEVAGRLAEAGLDVIGIERQLVGGECPYWGCIPSKMAIRAANSLSEARRVDELAGSATVVPDWGPVAARIRDEATDDWNDEVAVDRFVGKGGRFRRGIVRRDGRTRRGVLLGSRLDPQGWQRGDHQAHCRPGKGGPGRSTAAGPAGGEVLGLLVLAVHAGVPIADLRRMIFAYPTFHRAIEDALRDLCD